MVYILYKIGFEAFAKNLAMDLGGSKRLHALSTAASGVFFLFLYFIDLMSGVSTLQDFDKPISLFKNILQSVFYCFAGRYDSILVKHIFSYSNNGLWICFGLLCGRRVLKKVKVKANQNLKMQSLVCTAAFYCLFQKIIMWILDFYQTGTQQSNACWNDCCDGCCACLFYAVDFNRYSKHYDIASLFAYTLR